MAWEILSKRSFGRGGCYGPQWLKYPAVALTKQGLTMNALFCSTFGICEGSPLILMMDAARRVIGIKVATNADDEAAVRVGRKPRGGTSDGEQTSSLFVHAIGVVKRVSDCQGRAFRAHLNPGERVIEIDLGPENQLK